MRYGFTTGSCAAAASKAAAYMLLGGRKKEEITIETPKKILYTARILDIRTTEQEVSCAVQKDGGDDPDITSGALIYARVKYMPSSDAAGQELTCGGREGVHAGSADGPAVVIDGGPGVGRVTRPGLDQPVGQAAINHVPREMIEKEVLEVCRLFDYKGSLFVEISVPEGEGLAAQTFNPRLGIVGGISILGTSGIVEPMSNQAILDTIRVELKQKRAMGFDYVAVSPGNYGLDFMQQAYHYDLDKSVKCSNFIGETIDMALELGFEKMLLTGHIGKLIKVSGGIMNTHSREGDCRMELLAAACLREGVETEPVREILDCASTEEALGLLEPTGKREAVMNRLMEHICFYLDKRAKGKMRIDCILYANGFGLLAESEGVKEWFTLLERAAEQPT